MLVDQVTIQIQSGNGGDGIVAFRREKYVPKGGPSGGDGGRGGDVILVVNPSRNTLSFFQKKVHFRAEHGERGGSSRKTGADADDLIIDVPPGTLVRDAETGALLADLVNPEDRVVVARGGRGGKGNSRFSTSSNRAPRVAEKGAPGEERRITLELKLIADVGLVGVPNAGKSTLLSVVSNATPRIADYPFTTLEPNLGVVLYDHRDLVFADIPGLIEGAHLGVGLGHAFLRHVQRTRLLVHLLDGAGSDPVADFNQINTELALFDDKLAERRQIVVYNKIDLPEAQARWPMVEAALRELGVDVMPISAATQQNTQALIQQVFQVIDTLPAPQFDESAEGEEDVTLYEMPEDDALFSIERDEYGRFRVKGVRIERAAAMTYWGYEEAVLRFQKILETLGVSKALEKAGVQPGDTVFIGDYELEWTD